MKLVGTYSVMLCVPVGFFGTQMTQIKRIFTDFFCCRFGRDVACRVSTQKSVLICQICVICVPKPNTNRPNTDSFSIPENSTSLIINIIKVWHGVCNLLDK